MKRLVEGVVVSDNYQANGLWQDAAGRLGLADTKLTGIEMRRRMNPGMPRQRDLSPDQQNHQSNAACPLSNIHKVILHQAISGCEFQYCFTTTGLNPVNFQSRSRDTRASSAENHFEIT